MRLVDFLIALLQAHALTLQHLSALFGEGPLVEILESMGDEDEDTEGRSSAQNPNPPFSPLWFKQPPLRGVGGFGGSYAELETEVRMLRLPTMLEFHLWAYPPYRAFIESALNLDSTIASAEAAEQLVNTVVLQAKVWAKSLPLPPDLGRQAERVAEIAWIRFRSEVLQRMGKRPMGTIR